LLALGFSPRVFGATLLASHFTGRIYTLSLDTTGSGNGSLSIISSATGCGAMPTWLTLDSASGTLYCFDEEWTGSGFAATYTVGANGSLKQTGQAPTTGSSVHGWPYGGTDGQGYLATVEYDPSTLTTYKLPLFRNTTRLAQQKFTMSAPGPNPDRQNAPHPHSVIPDPTGNFLLVPDLGADLIRIFAIDAASGNLNACPPAQAGAGDGPRHGAFWAPKEGDTKGLKLYTVNELSNSVSAWEVSYTPDSDAGSKPDCLSLTKTQTLSTYEDKTPPANSKAAEVQVSGNYVYAANRNDQTFGPQEDSLVTYKIDPETGAIEWLEAVNAHGWYPRSFAINKEGTYVAVGGQTSSNVAVLARDPATGKIGGLVASVDVATKGTDGGEDGLSSVVW
ncbi:Lactonase, 7-bladed beta-propeller-domain-containing protein, partial [Pseudomassariella vexata]